MRWLLREMLAGSYLVFSSAKWEEVYDNIVKWKTWNYLKWISENESIRLEVMGHIGASKKKEDKLSILFRILIIRY